MARAARVFDRRVVRGDLTVQMVIWQLPAPTRDRPHGLKYRLWCGRAGRTVVRYDNERGKGDHRHYGEREEDYAFVSGAQLVADFLEDVARLTEWRVE